MNYESLLWDGVLKRKQRNYNQILKYEYLLNEFKKIKRNCRNRKMVYLFEMNLNQNLLIILKELYQKKYKFSNYRVFIINNPKYRIIMSENMSDKLVNHLVSSQILLPILEPVLIDTNVATRIGKGSGYAFDVLVKYINSLCLLKQEIYILKIDIKKYFYSINHEILLSKIKEYIKDPKILMIVKEIINTTNESYLNNEIDRLKKIEINKVKRMQISQKEKNIKIKQIENLPKYQYKKGLPIGNMTSQILAVFYLNGLDHYIKEELKCKYYIRYMDDLVILDYDYNKLKIYFKLITEKINDLDLEINNKSNISKLSNGFTFLGYTFKIDNNLTIKCANKTYYRIKRYLKKLKKYNPEKYKRSIASYKGYLAKSNLVK